LRKFEDVLAVRSHGCCRCGVDFSEDRQLLVSREVILPPARRTGTDGTGELYGNIAAAEVCIAAGAAACGRVAGTARDVDDAA
jgi:hypothetical protein